MAATQVIDNVKDHTIRVSIRLKVLCVWIVGLCIVIELFSISLRNHRQVSLDILSGVDRAIAIHQRPDMTSVVVLGNSLVYEGLSQTTLQETLGNTAAVNVAGIPGSTYFDWEYGLRALFARGSKPDIVVFGISPSQFLRAPAVTALPVSHLWQNADILSYYLDWQPGLTVVGGLLLEHYSTFFSMRDVFRIYTRKQIAGYSQMVEGWGAHSTTASRPDLARGNQVATYLLRLQALQSQCSSHAQLILIVIPTRQLEDEADEQTLRAAAKQLNIPLIEPIREREWPTSQFQTDGYHLTPTAATEFTVFAGKELAKILKASRRQSVIQNKKSLHE